VLGAVHAAEHALIGLLPLFTICDRWDVGGVSMALHPSTSTPTIFVYDAYPGGAGIAELAYADVTRHVRATVEPVTGCPCDDGCVFTDAALAPERAVGQDCDWVAEDDPRLLHGRTAVHRSLVCFLFQISYRT